MISFDYMVNDGRVPFMLDRVHNSRSIGKILRIKGLNMYLKEFLVRINELNSGERPLYLNQGIQSYTRALSKRIHPDG